jgi:hypothetical protein
VKFLKYWSSSRDFNKLVIKTKMHADTHFWNFLCYMKIQYEFFIYILERLGRMHENKRFFFIIIIYVLTKTRYFNTGFVSLQYKNTNRYWLKCNENLRKITDIFLNNFFEYFFSFFFYYYFFFLGPTRPMWLGWTPANLRSWAGFSQPSMVTGPCQWPPSKKNSLVGT